MSLESLNSEFKIVLVLLFYKTNICILDILNKQWYRNREARDYSETPNRKSSVSRSAAALPLAPLNWRADRSRDVLTGRAAALKHRDPPAPWRRPKTRPRRSRRRRSRTRYCPKPRSPAAPEPRSSPRAPEPRSSPRAPKPRSPGAPELTESCEGHPRKLEYRMIAKFNEFTLLLKWMQTIALKCVVPALWLVLVLHVSIGFRCI